MVYNQESTTVIPVFQKNSQEQKRVKNEGRAVQGNDSQWCITTPFYQDRAEYLSPTPPLGTLPLTP